MVGRPFRRSGSGRYVIPEVREWSEGPSEVQEWSGGPPEGPGVDGKPFRRSVSGRYIILNVRERSGDPCGGPGGVGM